ncbi:SDR family NAD(P)-dependent oxidoreductase [Paenibacillus sinopodophylli]|uniref:SDR family NAD(P)-dependent oxidoreductase n=1 Tax=Paenibacillus sinopodophylli TaxID=1837342 RepID=UPI00110C9AE5|nr:SDR family NAD(P)-dependent oxidoreductase [Paenibacillus sinopodophylli]
MMTTAVTNIALITGASSGVGFELTKRMLSEGWQIIALIRSSFPTDDPIIINAERAKQLRTYKADLADFESLKAALHQIKQNESHVDVIFNNAGVSFGEMKYSKQLREMHFEINTAVPYIIYAQLKGLLLKGALKTVINTSSNASLHVRRFNPDTLDKPVTFKKLVGPYADSKLALSLWTMEAAIAASAEGINLRSVCPGGNKTPMTNNDGMPGYLMPIRHLFFSHPRKGASRLYDAAFGEAKNKTGIFLNKGKDTPILFSEQAKKVLSKVESIYQQEFANDPA